MVNLPKNLSTLHIKKAVDYVEKETADLVDLYYEQANVFSAIVGIMGVKALHAVSPYNTFGVSNPATKLKDAAAYVNEAIALKGGKPVLTETIDFKPAPPNKI